MRAYLRHYFQHIGEKYPNQIDYLRAQVVAILSFALAVLGFPIAISLALTDTFGVGGSFGPIAATAVSLAAMVTLYLIYIGQHTWSRTVLFVTIFLGLLAGIFELGITGFTVIELMLIPLVASALFGTRGTIFGTLSAILVVLLLAIIEITGPEADSINTPVFIGALLTNNFTLLAAGLILWMFSDNLQQTASESTNTAERLRAVADIAQTANALVNTQDLLPRLVEMLRESTVFYHVQIFLIDDAREQAVLQASAGYAAKELLARGHQLAVGSRSVVGQTTAQGEMMYVADTTADPMHRVNDLLPATRSELAIPLWDGAQVIGALDFQSTRPNAFTPDDIEILQIIASQVSVALRNTRLFDQIQSSLQQNQQLFEEAQANLQEVERLNRQLTRQAWDDYLATSDHEIGVQIEGANLEHQATWTPTLQQAFQQQQLITRQEDGAHVVALPLDVRGHTIGAVEVTLPPGLPVKEAREMIEAVTSRLALTLDNNRLFEEAQTLAQQEQLINHLSGRLQSAGDVDEMLQVALADLSEVLGAGRASIRLQASSQPLPTGNGHEQ